MLPDSVYPGLAWELNYDGPPTDLPTYLACAVYRHRPSVDAMIWTVMTVGRDVTQAADGDWDAARRQGMTGSTHATLAALALVCVDTSRPLTTPDGETTDGAMATVLSVDGEWMTWADALRWCVKGRNNLQDAVEAAVGDIGDRRGKRKPASGPVDPFKGDETAADKQRREADEPPPEGRGMRRILDAVRSSIWKCDDCGAMNAESAVTCCACGLGKGDPKPTTNLTRHPPGWVKCKGCGTENLYTADNPYTGQPCSTCGSTEFVTNTLNLPTN